MKLSVPEIAIEIQTPKWIDQVAVQGDKDDLVALLEGVTDGDPDVVRLLQKENAAKVRQLRTALKKVNSMRARIKTLLTPSMRDLFKAAKKIEKRLDEKQGD